MRERLKAAVNREVKMPRWALILDFAYRAFLIAGAATVIYLWWQAATRDEEADRNARIQSCSAVYAASESAWGRDADLNDQHADALFAQIVALSRRDEEIPEPLITEYEAATARAEEFAANAKEISLLRIGLGQFSAESVEQGNEFACPDLPRHLMVAATRPDTENE